MPKKRSGIRAGGGDAAFPHAAACAAPRISALGPECGAFLDDAVHELRTPLTAVAGYIALLAEESADLPPLLRDAVATVEAQSGRLTRQLDVLLEIARLLSGNRPHDVRRIDLAALVRSRARAMGFAFEAEGRMMLPAARGQIARALDILADNARCHGRPPFTITAVHAMNGAVVSVIDHGDGVPIEHVALIGRCPFRGSHDEAHRSGSGFSLILAALIAERQGGDLRYDRGGDATRFHLWLPAGAAG